MDGWMFHIQLIIIIIIILIIIIHVMRVYVCSLDAVHRSAYKLMFSLTSKNKNQEQIDMF